MIVFNYFPTNIQDYSYTFEVTNNTLSDRILVRKNEIIDNVNEFSKLEENWDGYEACKIDSKIIENVKNLIAKLPNKIFTDYIDINAYPNSNGTISLEFKSVENNLLTIEVGINNMSGFIIQKDSEIILFNCDDITSDEQYNNFINKVDLFNV